MFSYERGKKEYSPHLFSKSHETLKHTTLLIQRDDALLFFFTSQPRTCIGKKENQTDDDDGREIIHWDAVNNWLKRTRWETSLTFKRTRGWKENQTRSKWWWRETRLSKTLISFVFCSRRGKIKKKRNGMEKILSNRRNVHLLFQNKSVANQSKTRAQHFEGISNGVNFCYCFETRILSFFFLPVQLDSDLYRCMLKTTVTHHVFVS